MPYVERNAEGRITGLFAVLQPGYAEEWCEDADKDVVEFRSAILGTLQIPHQPGIVVETV